MQYAEENKTSNAKKAKPKSQTRFPKTYPSYVVAFSLQETYDDLITAQQMICNKRGPQESTNSITPTNSLKMFETEQAEKLNQNADKHETEENIGKNSPHNSTDSIKTMTPTNSLKYLNGKNTSDASLITIGEQENIVIDLTEAIPENNSIENVVRLESDHINEHAMNLDQYTIRQNEQISEQIEEQVEENTCNILIYNYEIPKNLNLENENRNEDTYPKLLYTNNIKIDTEAVVNPFKNCRKYKKKRTPKRHPKKANHRKHNNFKYKNLNKMIDTRLEKYYEKRNSIDADQIQKDLYSDDVTTVVSRTHVLHKIITRENLLEQTEFVSFINDVGLNEYDSESLSLSMSTARNSVISDSSQRTLQQKSSTTSSKNKDELITDTVKSVIKVNSENIPYRTDVINVAVAVAYNRSKVNTRDDTAPVTSTDNLMLLGSLTSSEMVTPFISNLTSDSPSKFEDFRDVTIETSDETLVNKKSSFGVSSDDFVIARTSSDFTKSSDDSTNTLKTNTETIVNIEPDIINYHTEPNDPTILETVINLGIYPEMTPSTSSDTYNYDFNDVIVTKNKYPINSNKGDNKEQSIPTKNILKKTMNQQKEKIFNKIINLPNQADIKALLNETEVPEMKCADEFRHPLYMPEMWDRLVMTLELAVKRLEDGLVEKITKELIKIFDLGRPKDIPVSETIDKIQVIKGDVIKTEIEQGLQCELVKNTIIDQIMQKLSASGPKIFEPGVALKTLQKTKLFQDFEVLKSPEVSQVDAQKGDTVTVSTVTYGVCNLCRLKTFFAAPINFIRENVLVLSSVPTFFVVLLCVYGFILLLMKPW